MNVSHELESLVSLLNFVAMGMGCSIFPDYIRIMARPGLVYKRIRRPTLIKSLGIIKRKGAGGLAESFYRFTLENFGVPHP